ncbi:solute carrier organic anion transporter family member 6C1-like [Apodemus sylvaticus]|uniref:solute carrier organic anion transporter family member 6C1-like n=1 Tax=Apodemus sylvaticus TaxID=10129 RepID=UPI00224307F6|nr:solute carrier organic anion transporter family member 6C1-like [Apodemus sylvaticus]
MDQDKGSKNHEVVQAQVVEKDEPQKTEESRKIGTYLVTLPIAVKKFTEKQGTTITDPKYSGPTERPLGLGPLVFPCLQRFNNIDSFLILCCFANLSHGMILALGDQNIKTYVSQLSLSRTEELILDSIDYFAAFLVSIFVAHFGGRGNRPRWVATATFVTWLSTIAFAVPYFNYELIKLSEVKEEDLCYEGKKPSVCEKTVIPHKPVCVSFFIFGQVLHGIAGIPLYLLSMTFISDHVSTVSCGLYLAIADASIVVGYLLGFLLAVKSSKAPVKEAMKAVGQVQRFRILQSGWWKSYIFAGLISFCTTLPLLCFSSHLPGAHKIRLQKSQEPSTVDRRLINKEIKNNLKSVLHAIWCLLRNPMVLTQTFSKVIESLTVKAYLEFVPHYLQTQFLITPMLSTLLAGSFLIPGFLFGRFFGGYIAYKLQMDTKNKLKFIASTSAISILLFLLLLSVECETAKFPGINDDYDGLGSIGSLKAPCNDYCGCASTVYNSICGRDEKQYFSPCFAGCSASKQMRREKAYYNCSCIKEGLTTVDKEGQYIDAFSGTCNTKCLTLPLFFAFYFYASIFSNLCSIPAFLVVIESVPTSWSSMSLGITFSIWRFIAAVPGPIFFTKIAELCCSFWDINACGIKVRCWIYNKEKLFYAFVGTWFGLQASTSLLCLYAMSRYDYVVKGKTKSLDTPVNDEKSEDKEEEEKEEEVVVKKIAF